MNFFILATQELTEFQELMQSISNICFLLLFVGVIGRIYLKVKGISGPVQADPPQRQGNEISTPLQIDPPLRQQIRQALIDLNDAIEHQKISDQIDHVVNVIDDIFDFAEKEKDSRKVDQFLNYYMPTTLKLLGDYATLEKQSAKGEHIEKGMRKFETAFDQIVLAFDHLLDELYSHKVMDIEAEIDVMDTMMKTEGLLDSEVSIETFVKNYPTENTTQSK